MRKCCYLIAFLFVNILNVYGVELPDNWVFMKKFQQIQSSPERYLYNEIAEDKSTPYRYIDGGITEVDPNDVKYYELANESLQKYLQDTGAKQHHVLEVTKASEQVVSGSMTRIDFDAAPTNDVDKNNVPTSRNDEVNVYDNNIIKCHSEIRDRPWINTKIIEVNCWE